MQSRIIFYSPKIEIKAQITGKNTHMAKIKKEISNWKSKT